MYLYLFQNWNQHVFLVVSTRTFWLMEIRVVTRTRCTLSWCGTCLVTEEELPYWHLEHEVLLAEAKANICNSAVEEAGGSEHQDQVEVPRKRGLEKEREVHCHSDDAGMEEDSVKTKRCVSAQGAIYTYSCMHAGTGLNWAKASTSSPPADLTGETSGLWHPVSPTVTPAWRIQGSLI